MIFNKEISEHQRQRIKKFVADVETQEAVFEILVSTFYRANKNTDISYLAAKTLAVQLLEEGKKELTNIAGYQKKEGKTTGQVGL